MCDILTAHILIKGLIMYIVKPLELMKRMLVVEI